MQPTYVAAAVMKEARYRDSFGLAYRNRFLVLPVFVWFSREIVPSMLVVGITYINLEGALYEVVNAGKYLHVLESEQNATLAGINTHFQLGSPMSMVTRPGRLKTLPLLSLNSEI